MLYPWGQQHPQNLLFSPHSQGCNPPLPPPATPFCPLCPTLHSLPHGSPFVALQRGPSAPGESPLGHSLGSLCPLDVPVPRCPATALQARPVPGIPCPALGSVVPGAQCTMRCPQHPKPGAQCPAPGGRRPVPVRGTRPLACSAGLSVPRPRCTALRAPCLTRGPRCRLRGVRGAGRCSPAGRSALAPYSAVSRRRAQVPCPCTRACRGSSAPGSG